MRVDLTEAGAEVAHAQPGRTVHVVGGERGLCAVNEAKSLKREASQLFVSVHPDDRLPVEVTPGRKPSRSCLYLRWFQTFSFQEERVAPNSPNKEVVEGGVDGER